MTSLLRTVGICGIGQMGLALALACWRSGYRVLVYGRDAHKLREAPRQLEALDAWMTSEFPAQLAQYGDLEWSGDTTPLADKADLVVEAIAEDMAAKVELWQALVPAAQRGAILCSTTSGLSLSEMGRRSGFGPQLVGTHFWNPPHLMPLVEVVRGEETTERTVQAAEAFCRSIGKRTVRVNKDVPGFIGNRMLHALWREAIDIVERGIASAEDVDLVARLTFGLRLPAVGPLENMDLVGLDLIQTIHRYLLQDLAATARPGQLLDRHVRDGRLGMKSGQGFYDWHSRDPHALIEARDRQIVRELRKLQSDDADSTKPPGRLSHDG